ncbi:MAG: glycosyltransferase family 2 protein [Phycisphaerales bacterium]|nr:glycosyltransferase family 2 protein [Phycisphaerales bacterium]
MNTSAGPITVIVPCRNAEGTLAEAMESVFAQSVKPLEILLIDDQSTDRSVEIARSFGPTVRVLKNPARGPGAARWLGVLEAKGKFIAFIDADDVIEPSKHERQLAILENSDPFTLVHTGSVAYWPDGRRPAYQRTGAEQAVGRNCTQLVFARNPVCGASSMLWRETILALGNYDPDLFGTEDFGMNLVASTRCEFIYVPEPLYRMRQHTTNITGRKAHMAYVHWLAQDKFRQQCPEAFGRLPADLVRQFMVEPVLRTVKEAYWRREPRDYRRLLDLAVRLDSTDPLIGKLWRRRWLPMSFLRVWDRLRSQQRTLAPEAR